MYACLREFLLEFGQGARGCIVGEQGWPAAAIYIAIPSILVLRITEWFGLEDPQGPHRQGHLPPDWAAHSPMQPSPEPQLQGKASRKASSTSN